MAKKKTKSKQKKPANRNVTREQFLQILIDVSERSVTGQYTSVDEFFTNQAKRLRSELEVLRKNAVS